MAEKTTTVKNRAGIHCRPSSVILSAVEEYPGHKFYLNSPKGAAELNSILALLALGLQCGDEVALRVEGPDAQAACDRMAELFSHEFDFPPR